MHKKKYTHWIIFVTTLLALLLLFGFVGVWVLYGSASNVILQVGAQRMRVERMTKDALVLADQPTALERAQAESEIQDTFAPWQRVQIGLVQGDASIGLPQHPPSEIVAAVNQSASDYTPIVIALQQIAAHPQKVDMVQLQIVLSHELGYFTTITQVSTLWQTYIDGIFYQLFWIETALIVALFVLVIVNFVLMYPKKVKV